MTELDRLVERLPPGAVSTHPGELTSRAHDLWPLALLRDVRGERPPLPLAIVFPRNTEETAEVLRWAGETGTAVVPRGGGSGVCGGAQATRRSVVLDTTRMTSISEIDTTSRTVTVEAGVRGDQLERELSTRGLTLGHYPQSLAISTVGGWIAAGSAGQASAGFGSIEDLVVGLTVVLADGAVLRTRTAPRSAAGPSLARLFVGSEGTLGVVTEAVLSASAAPRQWAWVASRPASFASGLEAVRRLVHDRVRPLVVRLYDDADAAVAFGSLGHEGGAVLVIGFDEAAPDAAATRVGATAAVAGADDIGPGYGEHWWTHRNDAVRTYRRVMGPERALGHGVVVDTLEIAGTWSALGPLYERVRAALLEHAEMVGCHLSHPYPAGASLYFTFLVRAGGDVAVEDGYLRAWETAVAECHAGGGTMTHHHGVGVLKAPFMDRELGPVGLDVLRRIKGALDPGGVLNPGKLLA